MMQIMIFDNQFTARKPHEPGDGTRWCGTNSESAVAECLGENDVLVANPPFVEAHGKSHQFHGCVSGEWADDDVEEFLLVVCVGA